MRFVSRPRAAQEISFCGVGQFTAPHHKTISLARRGGAPRKVGCMMPVYKPHDLVKKSLLTTSELSEIKQLVAVVNQHDKLHMRFYPELASQARTAEINNYLFYQDDRLVGHLSFWSLSVEKREMLIGAVHPAYRCQGIFRALFEEARREYAPQGVRQLILVCES